MGVIGISEDLGLPPTGERARVDRERGVLVGSRCEACGATSWPARAGCHRCGAQAMREAAFEPRGSLLSHTTVWIGRPGLEPPYVLGQVKMEDGPMVFCHVRGLAADAAVPSPVALRLAGAPDDVPPFWFEPEEDGR